MRPWSTLALASALLVTATTGSAFAADPPTAITSPTPHSLTLPTGERLLSLSTTGHDAADPQAVPSMPDRDPRRTVLSSLHALTGVVQTYDGMLTMRVLHAGGTESNPLMKPAVGNETVMLGVKIAAAVATVIGAETLWRDNHRTAAIVTSVLANSAMAMIARHNAQVLARLEGR